MKRNLLILCLVALLAFAFTSCGTSGGNDDTQTGADDCIHTFSENWSSNATQHWHAATCEHNDQKSDLADHTDADQDGNCDTCNYKVSHEHTYASEWTSDTTAHWHVATCLHTDVKGDYANHVDVNANGKCDVCDGDVVVIINSNSDLINAIIAAKGGVSKGQIVFDSQFISLGYDGFAQSGTVFNYEFGNNCAYFKSENSAYNRDKDGVENSATSVWEKWQELISAENVFGIYREDNGEFIMDGAATLDTLNGYYFAVSTLAGEYGVENILNALYTLYNDSSASDRVWEKDDNTGIYTFSFNYLWINRDVGEGEDPNVNYYEVSVSFTHNEYYVLTSLDIVCDCYTNSLDDERDNDYTYDDTTGTITMKPEGEYVADTYTFKVTQIAGDRTYVNEYPRSKFLPETFELFSNGALTNAIGDSITVSVGKVQTIYLGNFLPEGTSITFDPSAFRVFISVDGENFDSDMGIGFMNDIMYLGHTALGEAPCIIFNIHQIGTYNLTVSVGSKYTKTITINVVEAKADDSNTPSLTTITLDVQEVMGWDDVANSAIHTVSITATESGMYTVNIPQGLAAYDKESYDNTYGSDNPIGPWVDLNEWNAKAGSFEIYLEAGQTYEFYVATYISGTYEITYFLNVQ